MPSSMTSAGKLFTTMDELATRMYASLADGSLSQYMRSLLRNELIILDEVGYLALDKTARITSSNW